MKFPADKLSITATYEGRSPSNGWLVVDISKLDLDGVSRLYIDIDDVEHLRQEIGEQADAVRKAKELLGGL